MALYLNGNKLQYGAGSAGAKVKKYQATLTSSQYGWFTFVDENGNTLSPSKGVPLFATSISNSKYYEGHFIARANDYLFKVTDVNDSNNYYPIGTSLANITFDLAYAESEAV